MKLGIKLIILFIVFYFILILLFTFFGFYSFYSVMGNTQVIINNLLYSQSEKNLMQLTIHLAEKNNIELENVRKNAGYALDYIQNIFDNPEAFSKKSYWDFDKHIFMGKGGQHMNSLDEVSSIFIPNYINISDVKKEMGLNVYLNLIFPKILKNNPNIVAIYTIGLQGESLYYPNIGLANVVPPDYPSQKQIFFTVANPENNPERKIVWTPVYEDPALQGLMISVIAPIYTKNKFMGVIGIDITLDRISNTIRKYNLIEDSYSFLIDKKGRAIVLPDKAYNDILNRMPKSQEYMVNLDNLTNNFFPIIEKMKNGLTGFDIIKLGNKEIYIAYAPLEETGFSIGTVVDKDVIIQPLIILQKDIEKSIQKGYNLIIFILITVFFLIFILLFFYFKLVVAPIMQLKDIAIEIGKGNFNTRLNIKSNDELQELGDSFNKTNEILANLDKERKQIDNAKTEFLSITSHELRSPMTPMKAQLQMALKGYFGKLNEKQKRSLEIVLNNITRLDKILVDFLEISRIEAARLKFNFAKINLIDTINSVVKESEGFMPEKKIKIITKIEKLPIIEADPDRISQVLRNLINNAIKFTHENGKVEISANLKNRMILFSVKDNGIGIAEKDQIKLFEPFYQVDNMYQHKTGGTGLGLAICKGIIESQNGRIWLSSQPGQGTIFYFTMPLKPVKNIKAIRLLIFNNGNSHEIMKNLFKQYIGPLGEKEFENLKNNEGITPYTLDKYLEYLKNNKIMQKSFIEEFKKKIKSNFIIPMNKKKETFDETLSLADLKKAGLIK